MIKKSFAILLISVFLFSIFLVGSVNAQIGGNPTQEDIEKFIEKSETTSDFSLSRLIEPNFATIASWLRVYEEGGNVSDVLLKYLFLALIIALVYSTLAQVEFPESTGLRLVIAAVVGLLSTIAIQPDVLIAILTSYTALGVTLILFIPILILAFLTITVAIRANPIGMLIQKILWILYAAYLFISSGTSLLLSYFESNSFFYEVATFLGASPSADNFIALLLFIISIAVFFIAIVGNKFLIEWTAKEMREADIERYKDTAKRSRAVRETDADLSKRRHEL